jgi:hypothetical protein
MCDIWYWNHFKPKAKLGMSFVSKASMHKWCDLVLEIMDGPTNQ